MSEDHKKHTDGSTAKYGFLDGTAEQQYLATQAFIAETDKKYVRPLMLDGTPEQQFLSGQAFIAEIDEMYDNQSNSKDENPPNPHYHP